MFKKKTLSPDRFQEYLDHYFLEHKYPKDLCPSFGLSVSNHSRRIRRAIELELSLTDGTKITEELYRQEKLRQDEMWGYDIKEKYPTMLDDVRYIGFFNGTSGQKKGRYTTAEEYIILTGHLLEQPYSEIQKMLPHRTAKQLKEKFFHMNIKERIPKLCPP